MCQQSESNALYLRDVVIGRLDFAKMNASYKPPPIHIQERRYCADQRIMLRMENENRRQYVSKSIRTHTRGHFETLNHIINNIVVMYILFRNSFFHIMNVIYVFTILVGNTGDANIYTTY